MTRHMYVRRAMKVAIALGMVAALTGMAGLDAVQAQQKTVHIGVSLPLTGADAEDAIHIKNGIVMAADEVNAAGGAGGYKLDLVVYDSGTATAGQYDPAQAATNIKKFVGDNSVVAV